MVETVRERAVPVNATRGELYERLRKMDGPE